MKQTLRVCLLLLSLAGCTGSPYNNFIAGLEQRQVTSCVSADLALGGLVPGGGGTGAVHVYTATGGMDLETCIRALRYGIAPQSPATGP